MRVLIVPDKLKGSLNASQASVSIAMGLRSAWPTCKITRVPLSDGGEGFVETIVGARRGKIVSTRTVDPLGKPCRAHYGLLPDGTAVVGLTEASGLWRVPARRRNPGTVTVIGTGKIIEQLVRKGCPRIIIGIGGSATNDGGIGLAVPLGYKFLDKRGRVIPPHGEGLAKLDRIVPPTQKWKTEFIVATDVDNPLYGPNGAAFQFAAQKGANAAQVRRLDQYLKILATVAKKSLGHSEHEQPGAGAAGGCGYGLLTFFGAKRVTGFDLFRQWTALDALIDRHDLVITGEGCLDTTSTQGKGPWAVAQLAKKHGKPVWAICGSCKLQKSRTPFAKIAQIMDVAPNLVMAQKRGAFYIRRIAHALAADQG
jgi:glycerate 2-kinase